LQAQFEQLDAAMNGSVCIWLDVIALGCRSTPVFSCAAAPAGGVVGARKPNAGVGISGDPAAAFKM
jgi:hypothetical protein